MFDRKALIEQGILRQIVVYPERDLFMLAEKRARSYYTMAPPMNHVQNYYTKLSGHFT